MAATLASLIQIADYETLLARVNARKSITRTETQKILQAIVRRASIAAERQGRPTAISKEPWHASLKAALKKSPSFADSELMVTACGLFSPQSVSLLLDHGFMATSITDFGLTTLMAGCNNRTITKRLIASGADPHQKDKQGRTVLHHISMNFGGPQSLAILLKQGLVLNEKDALGRTPLAYAVRSNRIDTVEQMLLYGASPFEKDAHDKSILWHAKDAGYTLPVPCIQAWQSLEKPGKRNPLFFAPLQYRSVKKLIDEGINPKERDGKGRTAVIAQCQETLADIKAIELLLDAGVPLNARDKSGASAILYAAKNLQWPSVKTLLDRGPNTKIKDSKGRDIAYYARRSRDERTRAHLSG